MRGDGRWLALRSPGLFGRRSSTLAKNGSIIRGKEDGCIFFRRHVTMRRKADWSGWFLSLNVMPPRPSSRQQRHCIARSGHCAAMAHNLTRRVRNSPPESQPAVTPKLLEPLGLTPRQAEVLHWMAEGKTNEEIALILECSFFTVKNHLKEIFQRLGVHSRTSAAACAYRTLIEHASGLSSPSP